MKTITNRMDLTNMSVSDIKNACSRTMCDGCPFENIYVYAEEEARCPFKLLLNHMSNQTFIANI